jgi:TetR/AcrR family fatty acid metabolism transcriptional regulator
MVSRAERRDAKRARILEAALRHFAERGYEAARVEDLAAALGIAKGSIFQHFESKDGLFLAAYKRAVGMLPSYLDAPDEVRAQGFFATLRYWLERTEHLVREDWMPYRMTLLGNYGTDLKLRKLINRFLAEEDPYGTAAFVRSGVMGGEVRRDVDEEMIVSILDWTMERFQDALLTAELDPGLFRRTGERAEQTEARIGQFLQILRGAIGSGQPKPPRPVEPKSPAPRPRRPPKRATRPRSRR